MFTRACKVVLLIAVTGLAAAAQTPSRLPSAPPSNDMASGGIRGRVVRPDSAPVEEAIKISLLLSGRTQTILYTDQQGMFEIGNLVPGQYTVEAEADRERDYEPGTERVEVFRNTQSVVTIYLRDKARAGEAKPSGSVVSAGELDNKVPAKARKEFERATAAAADGKIDEAVALLRKAIDIYPDYMKAHNDLGTHLLAQGKLEEAAEELSRAAALDPKAFNPQLNLAIVFVQQRRFAEASVAAEKAAALDSSSPAARLYAGLAFEGLEQAGRAEKELSSAYQLGGAKYVSALFHLGYLYMREGKKELARQTFESYLAQAPQGPEAERARRLMSTLQ